MRSGLSAQMGFKTESTWGTAVAVDRFLPIISESMEAKKGRLDSDSIYANRLVRDSEQWDEGAIEAGGSVELDVYTTGMGLLWGHALGSVVTTGAGPYSHAVTPLALSSSLTVQIGKPDRSGTVRPWNFTGCRVKGWELSVAAVSAASLKLDFSAKDLDKDGTPALQAFAPPAGLARLKWSHATVATVHGTSPKIKSLSIKGANGIEDDRLFLGSQTIEEQDEIELREYTGEAEVEFGNETLFDAFWAGTEADVALTLTRGAASFALVGNTRLDGSSPVVEGRGKLMQKIPFTFVGDGSDTDAMTITIVNTDATA